MRFTKQTINAVVKEVNTIARALLLELRPELLKTLFRGKKYFKLEITLFSVGQLCVQGSSKYVHTNRRQEEHSVV